MLDYVRLKELLDGSVELVLFDEIDSTNTEAKRRAPWLFKRNELTPKLFLARAQSAGRGRLGRSFLSRADGGIYMTLLFFTDKPLCDVVSVTSAAAVVVAEAIEKATEKPTRIKWVNDIYNDKGKACGILAETLPVSGDTLAVIVGVGINVGEDCFPDDLRGIAASIGAVDGKESDIVAEIVEGLLSFASEPTDRAYMTKYRRRLMLLDERVDLFRGGERICTGILKGVDDDGGLLLLPDGARDVISVRSGEISLRAEKQQKN